MSESTRPTSRPIEPSAGPRKAATLPEWPPSAPALSRSATVVGGRYLLEEPLGRGGMGSLWIARDSNTGERFALKVLHGGPHAKPVARARFRREAAAASTIDHPNVVRVLDHGEDSLAGPFLVMELLHGRTLADELAEQRTLGLDVLLHWLWPVAHALDAIHDAGLVHRDVTPGNIMRVAGQGTVKLVDFGLAKRADGTDRVTRAGLLVGTPDYVAPELADRDPSPASDVYSLAVTAHEAIAGKLPFRGKNPIAVLAAKSAGPPKPVRTPLGLLSRPLQFAFRAALSPNPADRHGRATQLVAALEAGLTTR